jgi:Mn-containing catalase
VTSETVADAPLQFTDYKTARATHSYLIVRDQAYENAYPKALETPGVH